MDREVFSMAVHLNSTCLLYTSTNGEKDKLTHAGMYGIQYSIASMEEIFDVDINYYVQINFTSLIMMVDALSLIHI